MSNNNPLIINLFGAPGAGKSTVRAGTFYLLKIAGYNVEEVTEFAKDLTWEKRSIALQCQPYVFGKQLKSLERLYGQVDIIVSDSPIILSSFYPKKYFPEKYPQSFHKFVEDQSRSMGGLNIFINRVKPYMNIGRSQTESESDQIAIEIRTMLTDLKFDFIDVDGNELACGVVFNLVKEEFDRKYNEKY
jgi:hypothetical protein